MGLVGRDGELDLLRQWFKEAQVRVRRAVFIGGEAGIGKTALLARMADEAHAGGAAVLYGRCEEELAIPYQPWVEALRHLVEHSTGELLSDHVAEYGGEVARLVPELRRAVKDVPEPSASDPEMVRYELFSAVVGLLGAVAAQAPVYLVLDDLHWADKQTILLLRHVIEHTTDQVFIAGTYRDVELTDIHPLSGALAALRENRAWNDLPCVACATRTPSNSWNELPESSSMTQV
jgi:predicted ATPase